MVRRSSSMMPIFTVLRGRPSTSSTRVKISFGEGDLSGPVHLRLDHVDRPYGVGTVGSAQARHRAEHRDHRVEQAFGHRHAVAVEHRRRGHQMADVADEHQRPSACASARAIGSGEAPIGGHPPVKVRPFLVTSSVSVPATRPSQL